MIATILGDRSSGPSSVEMRIVVVFNPIAGRGRAAAAAARVAASLDEAGHEPTLVRSERGPANAWLDDAVHGAALLVIAGGDGAVRACAGSATRFGVPIYQCPLGTENLFAREWGMDRHPETLLRAIERGTVVSVDTATANGEGFLLMASVGYDADVVHDLTERRSGGISHLSYVGPMLRQMRQHIPPRLRVEADGERIDGDRPGFVVVANCRQYAARLNPAIDARMDSGHLDIVWFPAAGMADLVGWMLRCRLGSHRSDPRLVYRRATRVRIAAVEPFRYQLDGDAARETQVNSVEIAIRPRSLRVLAVRLPPMVHDRTFGNGEARAT